MVNNNRYYVDKTGFIKPLMESGSFVQLITRPRRFGKTLFLDTVRTFLEVNEKNQVTPLTNNPCFPILTY